MKRLTLTLAFVLIAAACTAVVPIQPVAVKGTAMLPALKEGDRIIIERNPQFLERGDIVVFYFPMDPKFSYIKRIIGLPNEVIEIREGKVFVNGTLLNEPYVEPRLNLARRSSEPVKLAADSFYVVGDNRDNSSDSRIWGPLKREFIYGKYMRKYF
ncbi:MAG TPA: signal peptidase I [Pyrinomonadaceae bacterium]|nr:signal peptidase I [Pyrinomonadaceae bacterium]